MTVNVARHPDVGDRIPFPCELCGEREPSEPGYQRDGRGPIVFEPPPHWRRMSRAHCCVCLREGRLIIKAICTVCTQKVLN